MKIDAVDLTLFSWDDIPPTRYTRGSQNVTGRSNLGLLRIATDQGIEGHAFLGSALNPAETDAGALIRFLKPVLMGKDPLARADLHAAMRMRQRNTGLRVIGACDTALWDIAAKAAGMPLYKFLGGGRAEIGAMRRARCSKGRRRMRKKLRYSRPTAGKATRFTLRRARAMTSRCAKPSAKRLATISR